MSKYLKSLAILSGAIIQVLNLSAPRSVYAQGSNKASSSSAVQSAIYIKPMAVNTPSRGVLAALGNRLEQPGNERVTYQGTYTDSKGTTPATMVWQVPGYLALTLTNRGKTYVVDPTKGVTAGAALSASEQNILESFANDSPEAFLYTAVAQNSLQFVGGRFRTDNGKTPNYSGPFYSVFESIAPVLVQGKTVRKKFYYFDSKTKLFVKSQYTLKEGNSNVLVSTEYGGWTTTQSYPTPTQIVRKESGTAVFTFTVTSAAIGPQVNDGLFPGANGNGH